MSISPSASPSHAWSTSCPTPSKTPHLRPHPHTHRLVPAPRSCYSNIAFCRPGPHPSMHSSMQFASSPIPAPFTTSQRLLAAPTAYPTRDKKGTPKNPINLLLSAHSRLHQQRLSRAGRVSTWSEPHSCASSSLYKAVALAGHDRDVGCFATC